MNPLKTRVTMFFNKEISLFSNSRATIFSYSASMLTVTLYKRF